VTGPKRVTEKQLAANRANARRSTGPRTSEGKAIVSQNAVKHGVLAQAVIPSGLEPYESREDFERLHRRLIESFAPANALEELLVEQVTVGYWRLARLYRAEGGAIAERRDSTEKDLLLARNWARSFPSPAPDTAQRIQREEEALRSVLGETAALRDHMAALDPRWLVATDEELRQAAEARLAEIRRWLAADESHVQDVNAAMRSLPHPDTALKYARYETALQNQLHRTLSRLERLQCRRTGEPVAPPLQIDVTGLELTHDEN
jgi:hypothetical protein